MSLAANQLQHCLWLPECTVSKPRGGQWHSVSGVVFGYAEDHELEDVRVMLNL